MKHACCVQREERLRQLSESVAKPGFVEAQTGVGIAHVRHEIGAHHELHGDEAGTIELEELSQLDEIRMMQPLHGAKLALEARERRGAHSLELLQRNALAGRSIQRFVDCTVAAVAEQPKQLVLSDRVGLGGVHLTSSG